MAITVYLSKLLLATVSDYVKMIISRKLNFLRAYLFIDFANTKLWKIIFPVRVNFPACSLDSCKHWSDTAANISLTFFFGGWCSGPSLIIGNFILILPSNIGNFLFAWNISNISPILKVLSILPLQQQSRYKTHRFTTFFKV